MNVKGYRIAAKTGTAEVAGSDGRLTSIVADFAGMIPADNPRFAITVIMKDPQHLRRHDGWPGVRQDW